MERMLVKRLVIAAALLCASSAALADPIAYVAHGGGNVGAAEGGVVGSIDLATGAYTPLTVKLGSLTSLIHVDGHLWTYDVQSGLFKQIDPGTGAVVSSVAKIGGSRLTDMAVDPTDGSVYGVDEDYNYNRIDLATGNTTYLGPMDSAGGFLSLAFDNSGVLYTHATNAPGSFNIVDKTTGATLSTVMGGVPGGALGLAYEPESGLLIASECCNGPDEELGERLYSVDPATGAAVLLFDYNDGRRIHDIAFGEDMSPSSANLRLSLSGPRTPVRSGGLFAAHARLDNYGPDAARRPVVNITGNAPSSSVQVTAPSGWNCTSGTGPTVAITCRYPGNFPRGTVLIPLKVLAHSSMAGQTIELQGEASSASVDPQSSNNNANLAVDVRAATIVPTVLLPGPAKN